MWYQTPSILLYLKFIRRRSIKEMRAHCWLCEYVTDCQRTRKRLLCLVVLSTGKKGLCREEPAYLAGQTGQYVLLKHIQCSVTRSSAIRMSNITVDNIGQLCKISAGVLFDFGLPVARDVLGNWHRATKMSSQCGVFVLGCIWNLSGKGMNIATRLQS